MLDLLIAGAGPAGVSAAVQAVRDGLRLEILDPAPVGGLLRTARRLDNLPGSPGLPGPVLADRLAVQLEALEVRVRPERLEALELLPEGGFEGRTCSGGRLRARAVCLATGTAPAPLPAWAGSLPDGASTRLLREARGLPERLSGRRVVVVGGGEASLDAALWACDRGASVELLLRGARPRAPGGLVVEARAAGISLRPGAEIRALRPRADGYELELADGRELGTDWLLVCIGRQPRDERLRELMAGGRAPPEGVFLAGDVRAAPEGRYAVLAMADGLRAALWARARAGG
jgi:thioredoxin reductase (NADPH)